MIILKCSIDKYFLKNNFFYYFKQPIIFEIGQVYYDFLIPHPVATGIFISDNIKPKNYNCRIRRNFKAQNVEPRCIERDKPRQNTEGNGVTSPSRLAKKIFRMIIINLTCDITGSIILS